MKIKLKDLYLNYIKGSPKHFQDWKERLGDNDVYAENPILKKKKNIVIDADHLFYLVASTPSALTFKSFKDFKDDFKAKIKEYIEVVEVESVFHYWTVGKVKVHISSSTNFRNALAPSYKQGRPEKSKQIKKLQKWARKKYIVVEGHEADEACCYYVRNGDVGISPDKDNFNTEGLWFNPHYKHETWHRNSKKEANDFMLLQVLMGDSTDGVQGLVGVGKVGAKKILDEGGYSWVTVVNAYIERGLTVEDAVLTRNLVDMTIWSPKGLSLNTNKQGTRKDYKYQVCSLCNKLGLCNPTSGWCCKDKREILRDGVVLNDIIMINHTLKSIILGQT